MSTPKKIEILDHENNQTITENVPGGKTLRFLYGGNWLGTILLKGIFRYRWVSSIAGSYMNSRRSKKRIQPFIDQYKVEMEDYIIPKNGYQHFNDFFYRKLKPQKRLIEDGIISAADGRIVVFPEVSSISNFYIKQTKYSAKELIGNQTLFEKYKNGSVCVIRLAPVDYHRYHFPINGKATETKLINGYYYSVSPLALKGSMNLFGKNKRAYLEITNGNENCLLISVGATMTGSIIHTYSPNTGVNKGDEVGHFAFGGSTLVLLFEKDKMKFEDHLIQATNSGKEVLVRMGEKIGEWIK